MPGIFDYFISRFEEPIYLLYLIPSILVALSFHEWAHAYAAYRLGDPTARNLGRMTLNPFSHIDIMGFIMLILVGFGWAKPVPVNSRNFKNPRKDDIIVSLAGITTNILLAFAATGVFALLLLAFRLENEVVFNFLYYFIHINIVLFLFNLIPIPPLDGYHVLQALFIKKLGPKPFYYLERYGYFVLIILLFTGPLRIFLSGGVIAISDGMFAIFGL